MFERGVGPRPQEAASPAPLKCFDAQLGPPLFRPGGIGEGVRARPRLQHYAVKPRGVRAPSGRYAEALSELVGYKLTG